MINSAARESMERTLSSMKTRLLAGVRTAARTTHAGEPPAGEGR